jgi:hypothetical protein
MMAAAASISAYDEKRRIQFEKSQKAAEATAAAKAKEKEPEALKPIAGLDEPKKKPDVKVDPKKPDVAAGDKKPDDPKKKKGPEDE